MSHKKGNKEKGKGVKEKQIFLRVRDSKHRDYGRNIARIDGQIMEKLNINTGDIIELVGKKQTACVAWPSYPQDSKLGIIRIDQRIRTNSGTRIDDTIEIKKVEPKITQKILLVPINIKLKPNPRFQNFIKRKLMNVPVALDDFIHVSIGISRELSLKVVSLKPEGISIIEELTELRLADLPVQYEEKDVINFEYIGGLDKEIKEIKEIVNINLIQSSLKGKMSSSSSKGILLYGPSGTGKTLLAKAISYWSGLNFINLNGPKAIKYLNKGDENYINDAFQRAIEFKPSIIFIDNIDAIAPSIEKVVGTKEHKICSQLLCLIDNLYNESHVLIIGATNKPEILEPTLLRSGRLNHLIEFKIPDENGRLKIFEIHTKLFQMEKAISLEYLSKITDNFTGADISEVCREAMRLALKRHLPELSNIDPESETIDPKIVDKLLLLKEDFYKAIEYISHSIKQQKKVLE